MWVDASRQHGSYDLPLVSHVAELAEVEALPGAKIQTTIGDGDGDGRADQAGLGMRG